MNPPFGTKEEGIDLSNKNNIKDFKIVLLMKNFYSKQIRCVKALYIHCIKVQQEP